jgi:hypothetical protein
MRGEVSVPFRNSDPGSSAAGHMASKPTCIPFWCIGLNERVFSRPYEPIAVDHQVSARHVFEAYMLAASYFSRMFG